MPQVEINGIRLNAEIRDGLVYFTPSNARVKHALLDFFEKELKPEDKGNTAPNILPGLGIVLEEATLRDHPYCQLFPPKQNHAKHLSIFVTPHLLGLGRTQ